MQRLVDPPVFARLVTIVPRLPTILVILKALRPSILPRIEMLVLSFHAAVLALIPPGVVIIRTMRDRLKVVVCVHISDRGRRLRYCWPGYRVRRRLYRGETQPR